MTADAATVASILRRSAAGDLPANVALMQLCLAGVREPAGVVERQLDAETADGRRRLRQLLAMARSMPAAPSLVQRMAAAIDHTAPGGPAAIERFARQFDAAASVSPEASVALYALGDERLLAAASEEVVGLLRYWQLIGHDRTVVDLGCGIGRLAAALAPHAGNVLGLDISAAMVAEARRRTEGLGNVTIRQTGGRDLAAIGSGAADLILAADVFPYLVQAGEAVVGAHLRDAGRVLRDDGALVILNYAYGLGAAGQEERLRADAAGSGLTIRHMAERAFLVWDAPAFELRKG